MSDQPSDLTREQQSTMDGVEEAIDEAKQAEADLRSVAPDALKQPEDDPVPDARDADA